MRLGRARRLHAFVTGYQAPNYLTEGWRAVLLESAAYRERVQLIPPARLAAEVFEAVLR
jgi:hypothetical protein